jgi:hypothetical protein
MVLSLSCDKMFQPQSAVSRFAGVWLGRAESVCYNGPILPPLSGPKDRGVRKT